MITLNWLWKISISDPCLNFYRKNILFKSIKRKLFRLKSSKLFPELWLSRLWANQQVCRWNFNWAMLTKMLLKKWWRFNFHYKKHPFHFIFFFPIVIIIIFSWPLCFQKRIDHAEIQKYHLLHQYHCGFFRYHVLVYDAGKVFRQRRFGRNCCSHRKYIR